MFFLSDKYISKTNQGRGVLLTGNFWLSEVDPDDILLP